MVCSKCQSKLGRVITSDPWKSGARNTIESGEKKVNENKALTSKKSRFTPYTVFEKCRICNQKVHQKGSFYCQGEFCVCVSQDNNAYESLTPFSPFASTDCAYKKSICSMCGKKLMNTAKYAQSSA